jgi:putative transposase
VAHRRLAFTAGLVFHIMNRGARRGRLFDSAADYGAFLSCLRETHQKIPLRIFAYCLMPNHFHLVAQPTEAGQLPRFMKILTGTHSKRWHVARNSAGTGCVYQGRYRAIPVQEERYFIALCCYVERNPLRSNLVARAENWPWSSLAQRCRNRTTVPLTAWPILPSADWLRIVNGAEATLPIVRDALRANLPLGDDSWLVRTGAAAQRRRAGRPGWRQAGRSDAGGEAPKTGSQAHPDDPPQ